jgi:hypothetical protein
MKDTLELVKNVVKDPVPVVNTTVILGMSALEWELFFTVAVGFASLIWTVLRISNEYYKMKHNRETKSQE